MNTPAAKRRRVDAANATLRKPFHSPLLRRQPDNGVNNGTPGPSSTPEPNSRKRSVEQVYSPSSPSAAKQPQAATPSQPRVNLRAKGQPAASFSKPSSAPVPPHTARRKTSGPNESGAAAGPGGEDNPFLALARAHRTPAADRDATLRDLDRRLETVRQAREIEAASERKRPGEPVDQELRDLVVKWKAASRVAADELFETVKERVDSAGGPKAWKDMQQRQLEFYQGFDQEPPAKSKDSDEESVAEYSQDVQDHLVGIERCEEGEGKPNEDGEPEFNMGHMLQSLNIDFSLLGYDEKEDKWIN